MANDSLPPNQRRFFLTIVLGGISAVLSVAAGWPVFRFLSPASGGGEVKPVEMPRAKIDVGGAQFFTYHGSPAVVLQKSAGEFVAFSAVCTHLGCIVKWIPDKEEFLCPCHAGRFSTDGAVLGGPPPKPLKSIPVVLAGDLLRIG
ncbi:MAG: cytochrome B6 [Desulfuromonadaceae bacterium GWC2_58_13]|nr:MAG: cytochrome B6 [Desulfuromonadaceae bacterium GWC2_58_13]